MQSQIMKALKEWVEEHRQLVMVGVIGVILVVLAGGYFILNGEDTKTPGTEEWQQTDTTSDTASTVAVQAAEPKSETAAGSSSVSEQWYVDVKGAVKHPGVYPVETTMRIHDVVALAGGVSEAADESQVNFSQKVADQMVIYIPKQGEAVPTMQQSTAATETPGHSSADSKQVNLNTATKEELMTISGIGEKKAEDIIQYREQNGSFQRVDDLTNVSGIGEKTLEKLRPHVCV
ncbi:MAG: helix-hairpin-helix domain-containing protein [Aerococcus sp.]|nr:helix-hairpin-helix domain-containing protein [Aerococcus sp.]